MKLLGKFLHASLSGIFALLLLTERVLLFTRHALILGYLKARNQPNAFQIRVDLNAWNPTQYILNGAVGSIDTP